MQEYTSLIIFIFIGAIVICSVFMINNKLNKSTADAIKSKKAEAKKEEERAAKRASLSKSVKKIKWGPQFVIDKGIIDRDHKYLFDLINAFNENVPKFQTSIDVMPFLDSLLKYMQAHFKREEKLQKIVGFISKDEHKKEHAEMIEKFKVLIGKTKRADLDSISDVAVEIGTFLSTWLTEHVIENDLPMKVHVDKMKEHTGGMQKSES